MEQSIYMNMSAINGIDMKLTGIYKITSPDFEIYIGQSIDILKRRHYYSMGRCRTQRKLKESILKHGWHEHKFEILEFCESIELNDLEKHYVNLYQSFNSVHGLNLTSGGSSNTKVSDVTRSRMRDSHKGEKAFYFGRPLPAATIEKAASLKRGKKLSAFQLSALLASTKGRIKTVEEINKLRASKIGKKRPQHVIDAVSMANSREMVIIKDCAIIEFDSMRLLSDFLKKDRKSIRSAALSGKTYHGYKIFYL